MTRSETHGSDHVELCWEPPAGFTCFWAHGTSRRAGVGLVVREAWLNQFSAQEIIPGRAGRLSCRGPSGSIDIYSLYFHTGNSDSSLLGSGADLSPTTLRRQMREILHRGSSRPDKVWSLFAGDFNWVVDRTDRTPNIPRPELGEKGREPLGVGPPRHIRVVPA